MSRKPGQSPNSTASPRPTRPPSCCPTSARCAAGCCSPSAVRKRVSTSWRPPRRPPSPGAATTRSSHPGRSTSPGPSRSRTRPAASGSPPTPGGRPSASARTPPSARPCAVPPRSKPAPAHSSSRAAPSPIWRPHPPSTNTRPPVSSTASSPAPPPTSTAAWTWPAPAGRTAWSHRRGRRSTREEHGNPRAPRGGSGRPREHHPHLTGGEVQRRAVRPGERRTAVRRGPRPGGGEGAPVAQHLRPPGADRLGVRGGVAEHIVVLRVADPDVLDDDGRWRRAGTVRGDRGGAVHRDQPAVPGPGPGEGEPGHRIAHGARGHRGAAKGGGAVAEARGQRALAGGGAQQARRAQIEVVRRGPGAVPVVGAGCLVGRLGPHRRPLDQRQQLALGAGEGQIRPVELAEQLQIGLAGAAHRSDGARQPARVHRHQPAQTALDLLRVHHVGGVEPGRRAGRRHIVDLHGERRAAHGGGGRGPGRDRPPVMPATVPAAPRRQGGDQHDRRHRGSSPTTSSAHLATPSAIRPCAVRRPLSDRARTRVIPAPPASGTRAVPTRGFGARTHGYPAATAKRTHATKGARPHEGSHLAGQAGRAGGGRARPEDREAHRRRHPHHLQRAVRLRPASVRSAHPVHDPG
ncbi:hypothetical protein GPN2_21139 [Streptomyces murinus]